MKKLILLSMSAIILIFSTTAYAQTLPQQDRVKHDLSRVRGITMIAPAQQVPQGQQLQAPTLQRPDTTWDSTFNKPKDQNDGG
jgi:hypothetical protein